MSDTISFEMGSVDRPNRFQVNPVNHQKNNNDTENRKSYAPSAPETDAAASASASAATDTNGPHKVYPRLTNSDGETMLEDDTFDATQLLKQQQQPRQQRWARRPWTYHTIPYHTISSIPSVTFPFHLSPVHQLLRTLRNLSHSVNCFASLSVSYFPFLSFCFLFFLLFLFDPINNATFRSVTPVVP